MKINLKTKKRLLLLLTLSFSFLLASNVLAQGGLIPSASGSSRCAGLSATECGDYTVDDFIRLALLVVKWVFGIIGSLTLLMFVYGGFIFLISAGSSDKVSQAKKIITAAVVGLLIVFGSWLIIRFVLGAIGIDWSGEQKIQQTSTAPVVTNPQTTTPTIEIIPQLPSITPIVTPTNP